MLKLDRIVMQFNERSAPVRAELKLGTGRLTCEPYVHVNFYGLNGRPMSTYVHAIKNTRRTPRYPGLFRNDFLSRQQSNAACLEDAAIEFFNETIKLITEKDKGVALWTNN